MKVVVSTVKDFPDGERRMVEVNGRSVGVFRRGDSFYALRNQCPHQGGPLCIGAIAAWPVSSGPGDVGMDESVMLLACPWHGWEYDLATGQSFAGPGHGLPPALTYDVDVVPGSTVVSGSEVRADGRVPGPYIAETLAVTVEQDYVVVEDKPARR